MSDAGFDEFIHPAIRLQICGILSRADAVGFAVLRDALRVSDAVLSKQLKLLVEAGYVKTTKTSSDERQDQRRVVWVSLTQFGQAAFAAHIRALKRIGGVA